MQLPPLVFGAMAHHGAGDDDARVRLMKMAIDAGFTAFDTAPMYGFGVSERNVGRAVAGRDDVLVATKVGLVWDDAHGEVLFATPTHTVRKDSRPESVLKEIDQSLERLGRDHIDLVQVHHRDVHVPIPETMDALRQAHAAGKVRAIGVSNFSAAEMREAHAALGELGLFSTQDQYNLMARDAEREILPACRDIGCGFLCFSPLEQGVLSGALMSGRRLSEEDWRSGDPKYAEKNLRRIHRAIRESLQPVADRQGATLAQIALAWLLAEPEVTSVVVGARTHEHARANIDATSFSITAEERAQIRRTFEALELDMTGGRRDKAKRLARRGARKAKRLLGRFL